MNQQQLFTGWIDARHQTPKDGQKVLGYYQHDDGDPLGFRYGDMTIVGPVIWTHHQQYIDDGKIRPLVYWQAIDDLPGVGDVAN